MERTQKLEIAWVWARNTRLEAIRQKRENFAASRNPFKAQSGKEAEFERADQDIQALDVILSEIEDAHARARGERVKRKFFRLRDLILVFGLASLATLGFAAVCITVRTPDPVIQASAVVGVALSLAWAVKTARK